MKKLYLLGGIILTGAFAVTLSGLGLKSDPATSYQPRNVNSEMNTWGGASGYYKAIMANPETGEIKPAYLSDVKKSIKQSHKKTEDGLGLKFTSIGPDNVAGRTRAMLVDRDNNQLIYAGGVSGGLYVSKDGAGSWKLHDDFANNTGQSAIISCMLQAGNGDLYVGTGSSFDGTGQGGIAWPGKGVWVSRDGGETFSILESTRPDVAVGLGARWHAVNRLAEDKTTGRLYAATQAGLQISDDQGTSWLPAFSTGPTLVPVDDVVLTASAVVAVIDGRVYRSESGDPGTFKDVTANGFVNIPAGGEGFGRIVLAVAPSDRNIIYAAVAERVDEGFRIASQLNGVYKSTNSGFQWTRIQERIPKDDYFTPLYPQGIYNLALGVFPDNPDRVWLGGVELWEIFGGVKRVAFESYSDFSDKYIHADKHYFEFDPNYSQNRTLYVCSDGGISKSTDGGNTFRVVNKGYVTGQYYSVAFSAGEDSYVIGGMQDNGTYLITGKNENDPKVASLVMGNDGLDCEVSQIAPYYFVTSQYSLMVRIETSGIDNGNLPRKELSYPYTDDDMRPSGTGHFFTMVKLWESADDPNSKDVILFENMANQVLVENGDGVAREFSKELTSVQESGRIIPGTVKIMAGTKEVLSETNGTFEGSGTGTVEYLADNSIRVYFKLNSAPAFGLPVRAEFEVAYESNDVLNLRSATAGIPFTHTLSSDLEVGDEIEVRDPVQSLIALSVGDTNDNALQGVAIARGPLKLVEGYLDWGEWTNTGEVTCAEFTPDGNHLFVGTINGSIYRFSNLNEFYGKDDEDKVEQLLLFTQSGQAVTGISIDHKNPNNVIATFGNYGKDDHVFLSDHALSTPADFNSIQNELPPFPVYDAEFDINDPNIVVLGTEYGVWATENVHEAAVVWTDENLLSNGLTYVPVYDVRQQKLGPKEAKNHYQYFIATHGRGLWKSTSLVELSNDDVADDSRADHMQLGVYPNPARDRVSIDVSLKSNTEVNLSVIDLNGRVVLMSNEGRMTAGQQTIQFDVSSLRAGTYLVMLEQGGERSVSKLSVIK